MLRLVVLVLLLANAGYYAWSAGLLRSLDLGPESVSEPQRLREQIAPERLQLTPLPPPAGTGTAPEPAPSPAPAPEPAAPPQAPPASSPAPDAAPGASAQRDSAAAAQPGTCLQAGVFDARQAEALRTALAGWPAGSWQLEDTTIAGRWMVYMGRFPDEDIVARKRAELRTLKVAYDRPSAALEPGLSLGRFSSEEAARRGLAQLATQGVRTARVVQERADAPGYILRLPAATPAQRARLERDAALSGRTLRPCG